MEVKVVVRGDSDEEMKMQFVLDVGTEDMDDEMVVLLDCGSELSMQAVGGALMPVQDQCEALEMAEKQAKSSACMHLDVDEDDAIVAEDKELHDFKEVDFLVEDWFLQPQEIVVDVGDGGQDD